MSDTMAEYISMEEEEDLSNVNKKNPVGLDKTGRETLAVVLMTDTYGEAAEELGISRVMLWKRRKKYGLDKVIEAIPEEAMKRLKISSIKAATKLAKGLDDKDHNLAYDNAKEILDRVGITKKDSPQVAVQANAGEMKVEFVKWSPKDEGGDEE